jgi:THO complex subunit 1
MHPQRGKGPLLLRLLNELLRRLPKSKQEHVIFSGRILMFLSSVFPLGEKSGVNLRGNFNVGKATVFEEADNKAVEEEKMEVDGAKAGKLDVVGR